MRKRTQTWRLFLLIPKLRRQRLMFGVQSKLVPLPIFFLLKTLDGGIPR